MATAVSAITISAGVKTDEFAEGGSYSYNKAEHRFTHEGHGEGRLRVVNPPLERI